MLTWTEITIYTVYAVLPDYLKQLVEGGCF